MDTQPTPPSSVSPVQPAAFPAPTPKRRMHPAVIGAVVVGVLAVGYLAYAYLTHSGLFAPAGEAGSVDTSFWKTYSARGRTTTFEFQYPADWNISEDRKTDPNVDYLSVVAKDPRWGPDDSYMAGPPYFGISESSDPEYVGTDEQHSFRTATTLPMDFRESGVWLRASCSLESLDICEAILGTFHATDKSTAPDATAEWKTYANVQHGFEFQYPPTWIVQDLDITQGGIVANPPDFQMPTSGTVHFSFSIGVTAHGYSGDEQPVTRTFGTRTGYVYPKARSVYFPDSQSAGGYIIQLDGPAGSTEPDQILSTFTFTK